MVPADFGNFFSASAGAASALVGLLFVSVSLSPERTIRAGAPIHRQAAAGNTFTALLNALFVSLGALIPGTGLGTLVVVTSVLSLASTAGLGAALIKQSRGRGELLMHAVLAAGGLAVYGFAFFLGLSLVRHPNDVKAIVALAYLSIIIYGLGSIFAWELLGAESFGLRGLITRTRRARREQLASSEADAQPSSGPTP
jgi:hypothetical protein